MRDYGKVYSTFWSSATTGDLSDDGKLLALYLMTCTHATIAGVFRLPDGYVAEDLRWSIERVGKGFQELLSKGFANRCATTKWVWVRRHLEWNQPENPNQRKSAAKVALSVPHQCCWKLDFMRDCSEVLAIEWTPPNNPSPTLPQGSPNQEQEQEQKAGAGTGPGGAIAASPTPAPTSAPPAAEAAAEKSRRGTRLPEDFALPRPWGEWARAKYPHWTADIVSAIAGNFRNYWVAKAGKDATKLDWRATWENWCDSAITQREYPSPKVSITPFSTVSMADGVRAILGGRRRAEVTVDG